jgi:drug/metabolite transporter (DMT)-like permease
VKLRDISAYGDLFMAMAIVGSSVVCGKIITNAFPVFLASGMRFAIATALMLPMVLIKEKGLPRFSRQQWGVLVIMAFCGQFIFTCLLLYGLRFTGGMDAGVITAITPAAMAVMSLLLLRERLNAWQLLGILLAIGGVLVVNDTFGLAATEGSNLRWLGNALVCMAVLGEAVFLLLRKKLSAQVSNLTVAGTLCFLGLLMFLPFALWQAAEFDFGAAEVIDWLAIVYFGVVFTVAAYIFWFRGVSRVSGNTAGVFTAVMPVSAVTLSCLLLGEPLTLSYVLGGVMVLAAILCSTMAGRAPRPANNKSQPPGAPS